MLPCYQNKGYVRIVTLRDGPVKPRPPPETASGQDFATARYLPVRQLQAIHPQHLPEMAAAAADIADHRRPDLLHPRRSILARKPIPAISGNKAAPSSRSRPSVALNQKHSANSRNEDPMPPPSPASSDCSAVLPPPIPAQVRYRRCRMARANSPTSSAASAMPPVHSIAGSVASRVERFRSAGLSCGTRRS